MQPATAHSDADMEVGSASGVRTALAWGVHFITAGGGVVGTLALVAISRGRFDFAAVLMLVALVIDSFDGTLARAVGVSRILPSIDGRRLDDIVDYLNYVIVPAVFMLEANSLPHWGFTIAPVLASSYGFAHIAAKTEDNFFRGFPSYWNVVAIYLWGLGLAPALGAAIVIFLSVMVFVPLRYAYPSRMPVLRATTGALGILWSLVLAACVLTPARVEGLHLLEWSLLYPAYYLALSFWLTRREPLE